MFNLRASNFFFQKKNRAMEDRNGDRQKFSTKSGNATQNTKLAHKKRRFL